MSDWVVVTYFPVKHLGGFLSTLRFAIAYFGYNVGFTFHVVVDRESNDFGDGDGEPYLDIAIICDANNVEELRVPDLVGYLMTLRDKLVGSGVEEFPVPSFFLKSEWEGLTKSSGSR